MMIGEQNPLDSMYADLAGMFQHAAVAEIDQQRGIAVTQNMDVAGVCPDEEVRQRLGVRLGKGGGRKLAATNDERGEQRED